MARGHKEVWAAAQGEETTAAKVAARAVEDLRAEDVATGLLGEKVLAEAHHRTVEGCRRVEVHLRAAEEEAEAEGLTQRVHGSERKAARGGTSPYTPSR